MREPSYRTAEIKVATAKLEIWCNDFCVAFEQDEGRLLSSPPTINTKTNKDGKITISNDKKTKYWTGA